MKRITTLILSLFIAQLAWGQDEPNYQLEDRFHKLYKEYHENPTPDEVWGQAYSSTAPRQYEVMKNDTLWDISKVLFADPFFWPKIWSFNMNILNPHEISPGDVIRFMPGTLQTPPAIAVKEFQGLALPESAPSRPIAQLPDSLPQYEVVLPSFAPPEIIQPDLSALTKIPPMPLPVEILDQSPSMQGQIVEIEEGSRLAADTRDLFVKLEPGVSRGVYTVVKNIERNKLGFIIQYRAEIRVMERINDRENIHRAKLLKNIDSVEVGDYIVSGSIPMVNVEDVPTAEEAPLVRIIGGFRSPTDLLYSPFSFVFINAGTRQGLEVGKALRIYQDPKIRLSNSRVLRAYREVGKLRILRVQENTATAYILKSSTEIREGDFAGVLRSPGSGSGDESDDADLTLE